jgi:hypothetical protein
MSMGLLSNNTKIKTNESDIRFVKTRFADPTSGLAIPPWPISISIRYKIDAMSFILASYPSSIDFLICLK